MDAKHEKDMVAWLHSKMETLPYDPLVRSFSTGLSMLLLEKIRTGKPDAHSIAYELDELRLERVRTDPEYHAIVKDKYLETIIALRDEANQMWNKLTDRQNAQHHAEKAVKKAAAFKAKRSEAKLEARR